jgi:hypothetical protein
MAAERFDHPARYACDPRLGLGISDRLRYELGREIGKFFDTAGEGAYRS